MTFASFISILFPHFDVLRVDRIVREGRGLRIYARGCEPQAACSGCGVVSGRVHSGYERKILDQTVAGSPMVLFLTVRRFFCGLAECGKTTFAEQIPGLTFRYGRSTLALRRVWEAIALALGGRAGARLTAVQAIGLGRDALIRLVRALPDPRVGAVRVLGVDDFALRKGHHYGTILVDLESGRPVDVLPERSADALVAWLDAHPGTEIVCRDRASCYSDGATRGAPSAIQVADRWHLLHNLSMVVERAVARLRAEWIPPTPEQPAQDAAVPPRPEGPLAQRHRERHAAVHALMDIGVRADRIADQLRLSPDTVRKFMRAATADELIVDQPSRRASSLDDHAEYLARRWAEGCTSTSHLHRELRERGLAVSERTVRRFLVHMRANAAPATAKSVAPKNREVTALVLSHPDTLTDDERLTLRELRARCPDLDTACSLVSSFAEMLVHRRGEQKLEAWVQEAQASNVTELRGFATGLRKDWNAVMAGLSLPWSSGPVEGHVNRVKMLKRQMFGRAKPDLLRKRVLLS